ncbi:MAG: hypothetical protein NZ889_02865 [Candidatus Pacearchaeota archaeon]|nr:hypothetical protein [Candidatus Pacearchaeota archaeon]
MKIPILRFVAFLVFAFLIAVIAHETIHIIQAKINQVNPEEVCFLGYSKDGAGGWVVADVPGWGSEKAFFKYEFPAIIVTFIMMGLITYLLILHDLKYIKIT